MNAPSEGISEESVVFESRVLKLDSYSFIRLFGGRGTTKGLAGLFCSTKGGLSVFEISGAAALASSSQGDD